MPAATDLPSLGRELLVIDAEPETPHPHRAVHNASSFVAQLIANVSGQPQARVRRRADPAEAIAAYRETIARIQELNVKS